MCGVYADELRRIVVVALRNEHLDALRCITARECAAAKRVAILAGTLAFVLIGIDGIGAATCRMHKKIQACCDD